MEDRFPSFIKIAMDVVMDDYEDDTRRALTDWQADSPLTLQRGEQREVWR